MTIEMKTALAQQVELIARKAGPFITNSKIGEVMEKGSAANIATDIDIRCQRLIIDECSKCLPDSSFFAEEDGCQQIGDRFTWVIDPIDGTTNYLYDLRHFCVSIALYHQKKGVIGAVYDPVLDECFVGIDGVGSTCNGRPIHVSGHPLSQALVLVGTPAYDKQLADVTFSVLKDIFLHARDIRRSGSAALDLCYVACGRVDAFYEQILRPWDYGAGSIILRGAQGTIEPIAANAFDELEPTGVICSNGVCHGALRDIVRRYQK